MISSCELVERTSKSGKKYYTLDVTFINGYTKVIFLDTAEQYMLKSFTDK